MQSFVHLVFSENLCYFISMTDYRIVRSRRRTLALEITKDCTVVVRAPYHLPEDSIDAFVRKHRAWIDAHLSQQRRRQAYLQPEATKEEISALKKRAEEQILPRVKYYAKLTGLEPAGVRITQARSRYGSCSPANRLCFSCFLVNYPPEVMDLVVVHELVHIQVKNHGPAFYARLEEILPDWRTRKMLLRQLPDYEKRSSII